ncbi:MAG: hypothetical protein ACRDFX_04495 [Chloroflexota bacterium]
MLGLVVAVLTAGAAVAIIEIRPNAPSGNGIVPEHAATLVVYTYADNGVTDPAGSVRVRDPRSIAAIAATLSAMRRKARSDFYPGVPGRDAFAHDLLKFRYVRRETVNVNVRISLPIVIANGLAYGNVGQWQRLLNEIDAATGILGD